MKESEAENLEEQAERMRQRAGKKQGQGALDVGSICQLGLADVDRAKLDNTNATVVIVETVGEHAYRVANRAGVYKEPVSRSYLTPLPHCTPILVGLDYVLKEWTGMPKVGIRAIAASLSHAGGQGMQRCDCKGDCMNSKCSCHLRRGICATLAATKGTQSARIVSRRVWVEYIVCHCSFP